MYLPGDRECRLPIQAKLMDINVRGLNSKLEVLTNVLHKYQIDFATLQETHVNGSSKIKIPGYYSFSKNRPVRGSKGGVAILIGEIYKDQAVLIHESSKCEFIAVKLCNESRDESRRTFFTYVLKLLLLKKVVDESRDGSRRTFFSCRDRS